jgi:hypothetical protein
MAVKLAILKSGENIVADIKEGFLDNKLVCYIFQNPCLIEINGTYDVKYLDHEDQDEESMLPKVSISVSRWPTLSNDETVEVSSDWIITVVNPTEEVKNAYSKALGEEDEFSPDIVFSEQSDSDNSD